MPTAARRPHPGRGQRALAATDDPGELAPVVERTV
jgi:hypothetical protein